MRVRKEVLLALALAFSALLSGCMDRAHYDRVEKKALKYYQNKYSKKDVEIVDSYKAGNNGLFGYLGVEDRAYEMSDGSSVYWDDSLETFADNAQADQIRSDFEQEILQPLLAAFPVPYQATPAALNRTNYDSFDESVFTAYYDGDIRTYLAEERPRLDGLQIALQTEDRETGERAVEAFYEALKPYVKGSNEVFLLTEGLDALSGDDWYPDTHAQNVLASASLRYDDQIRWYRKLYVEAFADIKIASVKANFDLQEGDVVFEQVGTCADLQKLIDEGYYGMPVDAEENKNGGYSVHDQRHESHVVLDDPDAPLYRAKLSQRVLDELDSRNCLSLYVLDNREDGLPLMIYYTGSTSPYSVFRVRRPSSLLRTEPAVLLLLRHAYLVRVRGGVESTSPGFRDDVRHDSHEAPSGASFYFLKRVLTNCIYCIYCI